MSDIYNKLNSLKSKLNNLEQTVSEEVKKEQSNIIYKDRLNQKLPIIKENQLNKIKFNVGNEVTLMTSNYSIKNFPYKLTLKDEILGGENEIFVDSSESIFSAILEIIRTLANEKLDVKKQLVVTCNIHALEIHAKEYFQDDTAEVLKKFDLIFNPPWVKKFTEKKPKRDPNKWTPDIYILCYSCGTQNDGSHWRKRATYDRGNDSYCIDNYIATCLSCDPENTLQY